MTLTDYMFQEKKEDSQAVNVALKHRYNDLKITSKNAEEDWLQPPETIQTTRGSIEQNN